MDLDRATRPRVPRGDRRPRARRRARVRRPRDAVRPGDPAGARRRHRLVGGRLRRAEHGLPGARGVLQGPDAQDGHLQRPQLHGPAHAAHAGRQAPAGAHHHPHDAARRRAEGLRDLRQEGRPRDQGDAEALACVIHERPVRVLAAPSPCPLPLRGRGNRL